MKPEVEQVAIEGQQPFVVCAFYTDSYQRQMEALRLSLKQHRLNYYLRRYESRGFWEANTGIKPEFLLDCLDKFPGMDIVYLDADAVVKRYPALFHEIDADVGVCFTPEGEGFSHRVLTGTLFFKNNPVAKHFVEVWLKEQRKKSLACDQDSFERALDKSENIRYHDLPVSYVKIFDKGNADAVIEHYQASRGKLKFKKLVKRARNISVALVLVYVLYLALANFL